jgi:hypothetical protein
MSSVTSVRYCGIVVLYLKHSQTLQSACGLVSQTFSNTSVCLWSCISNILKHFSLPTSCIMSTLLGGTKLSTSYRLRPYPPVQVIPSSPPLSVRGSSSPAVSPIISSPKSERSTLVSSSVVNRVQNLLRQSQETRLVSQACDISLEELDQIRDFVDRENYRFVPPSSLGRPFVV